LACEENCTIDLVMEGGGIKGLGLVGALSVLEDRGYRVVNCAGTSAGAIVAALHAAGYSSAELRPMVHDLDFTQFLDGGPRWLPPLTRKAASLLAHWGLYKGDAFLVWIRDALARKGVRTFADLRRGIRDRGVLYPLRVVASDVTRGRMVVLPEDAAHYGIAPDDLDVGLAVRMSMSIPGLFRPVTLYTGWPAGVRPSAADAGSGKVAFALPRGVTPCYIVDGCLLSNFPIKIFDGPGMDSRPTLGIRLASHGGPARTQYRADGLVGFVMAMCSTAMGASDAYYLETHSFMRTIEVDNLGISPIKFDMDAAEKSRLYEAGAAAARSFLETWDFDQWRRSFAEWAGVSRRAIVRAAFGGQS
jgi:NTE family protein